MMRSFEELSNLSRGKTISVDEALQQLNDSGLANYEAVEVTVVSHVDITSAVYCCMPHLFHGDQSKSRCLYRLLYYTKHFFQWQEHQMQDEGFPVR